MGKPFHFFLYISSVLTEIHSYRQQIIGHDIGVEDSMSMGRLRGASSSSLNRSITSDKYMLPPLHHSLHAMSTKIEKLENAKSRWTGTSGSPYVIMP